MTATVVNAAYDLPITPASMSVRTIRTELVSDPDERLNQFEAQEEAQ